MSLLQRRFINNIATLLERILIDVVFTLLQRYDMVERCRNVKPTTKQRRYDVLCLLGIGLYVYRFNRLI